MLDSDQVSHYPGEMAIRINYIQLGNPKHTPVWAHISSHGSPFALFGRESGLSRKARGTADARLLRPYLQARLSPRPSASCFPPYDAIHSPTLTPNEVLGFTVNYNSGPYYVFGTFNLNQGPDNGTVLNGHRRDQEHMPSRHQQQP
jgi:hypothetical protein